MSTDEGHFLQLGKTLLYWVKNFLITGRFSALVLLSLADTHLHPCLWLACECVCVCVCVWRYRLPVFNYSPMTTFQLEPPPPHPPCRAQFSSALLNFFPSALFLLSLFRLFAPSSSFHAWNLSSPPSPLPRHPSQSWGIPSLPWKLMGVALLFLLAFHPPNFCTTIALPTKQSPLMSEKTCRHPGATFDHCFCWESSLPCSASGWQEDGECRRMKGRKE